MEWLAGTWFLWFALTAVLLVALNLYRDARRKGEEGVVFHSESEFSVTNLLFGLQKGQGDLFITYLLTICFFTMFLVGFSHWVRMAW